MPRCRTAVECSPSQVPARTAASDGQRAFTRACAKRRAQVCGDSTVKSDGSWAGSPHPPLTRSPFPEKKEWRVKSEEWSWRPLAVNEVSKDTDAHYCKLSLRKLKPAGRSPTPPGNGMPAALWGDVEGFRVERNPSTDLPARTAASDGQRAITRACAKRRAQVCGDSTVKSDGH